MTVPADTTLHAIAGSLAARVAPAVTEDFAGETLRLATILLTISANAADDAAALRVDENRAMREFFAAAAVAGIDGDLAAQLGEAAGSRDPGMRLSELDAENDRLRRLLTALHAQSEDHGDSSVAQQIWRMLDAFEARRAPRV